MPIDLVGQKDLASRIGLHAICTDRDVDKDMTPSFREVWAKLGALCERHHLKPVPNIRQSTDIK